MSLKPHPLLLDFSRPARRSPLSDPDLTRQAWTELWSGYRAICASVTAVPDREAHQAVLARLLDRDLPHLFQLSLRDPRSAQRLIAALASSCLAEAELSLPPIVQLRDPEHSPLWVKHLAEAHLGLVKISVIRPI